MNATDSKKWVKRFGSIVAVVALMVTQTQGAFARILFEDDDYFNVQSEGIILDYNDNVYPGEASTATSEGGTYTAVLEGVAGDNISIVIVDGANCDITTPGSCTVVNGNTITITADLNDANGDDTDTDDVTSAMIVAEINAYAPAAALVTASSGDGTSVTAGTINLAGGVNGDNIELQFGNDGTDATITYNDTLQDLVIDTPGGDVDFTDNNITTTGGLLLQNSSEFHIREDSDPATNSACTTLGEVIIDTTDNQLQICTVAGAAGFATWLAMSADDATTLDGIDSSQFLRSDTSDNYTSGTLQFDVGTTLDVNGAADFSGSTQMIIRTESSAPGTCTEGEVYYDTTSNQLYVCTATDTWTTSGPQDFEDVYATDADNTLSASSSFDIDATGAVGIDSDAGITIGGDTIGLTSDGGNITFSSFDDITFIDAQLGAAVQLTDSATGWNGTFSTNGIIDNINSFTSNATGEGASNVGIEDASSWFTGTEIETALNEIEALFGSTTSSTFSFTENNVLVDDESVYASLNRLDLKWGDLASTTNGEGASLVGIEDTGDYYTGTTVESALQEIGASIGNNYDVLTFYPEYEDAVVHADGSDNKGTLEAFYDSTEETGYYHWTSNQNTTQDIDIRMTIELPTDFVTSGDFTYRYRTGTVTEAENDVEITVYNVTDAATCGADLTNGTAGTWATGTISAATIASGCSDIGAGDLIEIQIKLYDDTGAGDYADIGWLNLDYTK